VDVADGPSFEIMRAGQQLYAVIEFCSTPEAAWAKIESGHYDWLGMKGQKFVFGRPPVNRSTVGVPAISHGDPGADGAHVVEVRIPGSAFGQYLHATAEAAWSAYYEAIDRLQAPDGSSGLWRVRLIANGAVESEQLVVRLLPNVL
jgi:hypothetical protein